MRQIFIQTLYILKGFVSYCNVSKHRPQLGSLRRDGSSIGYSDILKFPRLILYIVEAPQTQCHVAFQSEHMYFEMSGKIDLTIT